MSRFYTLVPRCSCITALIASLLLGVFGVGQNAFARPPQNEEEALQCMLYVTAFTAKNEVLGHGSAFIAEENGVFWIYTNAHNLAGAARVEFLDFKGVKLKGFGKFACYSDAAGVVTVEAPGGGKNKYGCDGVKIELKEKRLLGFEIEKDPINVGDEVITLGDKGGTKAMDILEGKISKVTSKVLMTTCKTAGGCSGGALVLKDSWRVIGLHTWGVPGSVKAMDLLWSDGQIEDQYAGASRIDAASWIFMSARDFMKGSKLHAEAVELTRILAFLYLMTPTKQGFHISPSAKLAVNTTFGDTFARFNNNTILKRIISLNESLGRAKNSPIKIANTEVISTYAKVISRVREDYKAQQVEILKTMAPYYRVEMKKNGFFSLGKRIYHELETAEDWFKEKDGVGGVIPLAGWFNLPPLADF